MTSQIITIIFRILLVLTVFYYIYPQALDVGGSSFISVSGLVGLAVFVYQRMPFKKEILVVVFTYLLFAFCFFLSSYINSSNDPYMYSYTRSQFAWFFTAYLISFCLFRIHKIPSFTMLVRYIVAGVFIQCVITLLMHENQEIADFFISLQLQTELDEEKIAMAQDYRLMGYGTGFFGAGMVAGYGLIFTVYLVIKEKMNFSQIAILTCVYTFIFYIGLFSARTTLVGAAVSVVFLFFILIFDPSSKREQGFKWLGLSAAVMLIGAMLSFAFFPDFTDWAFELYYTFMHSGSLQTRSSNGLTTMFYTPSDFQTWLIGTGYLDFFGSDVGYTRIMFFVGIIGSITYFLYSFVIACKSLTKDFATNTLIFTIFIYTLALNVKGFTDLNSVFYLIFFFFLFYKYEYYYPKLEYVQKRAANGMLVEPVNYISK